MLSRVCASLLLVGVAGVAFGQSLQTVPPAFDAVAGSNGNSIPQGNYPSGTYQVMYAADQLTAIPVGSVITGMQLRLEKTASATFPTAPLTITRYDIKLATSLLTPATMSATFASNMSNPVQVRSGSFKLATGAYQWLNNGAGVPEPWGPVIPFTTGYAYAGGPLVIEMRVTSPSNTFNAYADVGITTSARRMHQADNADAITAGTLPPSDGGLVVRLTFTPPTADLAKGVTKVIVGEKYAEAIGNSGEGVLIWSLPFTQQAVASANQFDTIGPGTDFVGVSWRQSADVGAAWPGAVATFGDYTLQLSRSQNPPSSFSTTIASNVGADAVTVRTGALSLPIGNFGPRGSEATSPFAPEVGFSKPYQYRSGPLLAVTRHTGQGSGSFSYLDAIFTGSPDTGVTVKAFQVNNAAGVTTNQSSAFTIARYSVDAGTSSPLNQLAPGSDGFGIDVPQVLQTVLSASELKYIPVGSVIDSLWLRQIASAGAGPATNVTAADFEVAVSSATNQPSGMSTNFAANEGADKVLVHDGGLFVAANTMPAGSNGNFGKIVQFQKSFVYKGGPLCITIRHTGLSAPMGNAEALFGTAATNRSTYAGTTGAATGLFYNPTYTGTAMKLGYIPSVMTPNSLATAEGSSGWNLPFNSNYTVQTIIPASQLRTVTVGSAITGFSLRAEGGNSAGFPSVDTNLAQFDVTISPAARSPLAISTTFASNIGPGAVTVRSGAMTVPANAYPALGSPRENAWYVPFSRAYVYTGGDLCVTFRGQGALTGSSLYFDGESNNPLATGASIYNYGSASATAGNPWGPLGIRLAFTPRAFCPWDLNNDGVVEDADFTIFLSAYNMLDCADPSMPQGCPADFNYDRVVDDADFSLFVVAYNALLCP